MKRFGVLSTAALLLLLGSTASAYARQEQHEQEAKPEQQQEAKPEKQQEAKPEKQQEAKPAKQEQAQPAKQEAAKPVKQQEAKPAKQEQAAPAKQQQQAKAVKQEQAKPQQQQAKSQQQQTKSNSQQHAQRTPAEVQRQHDAPALRLSARGSGRIPDDRFHSNFGHEHVFVISQPVMVGGYSRFQYGGYWFGFVQPWPVGWYYTDDVYVDYIDGGYYLYNPYYPGARVSISVVI
jgi:primosomal protein N'